MPPGWEDDGEKTHNGQHIGWAPIIISKERSQFDKAVRYDADGRQRVLELTFADSTLYIRARYTDEMEEGATVELIGTNMNKNPYNIGRAKRDDVYMIAVHGAIPLHVDLPPLEVFEKRGAELRDFFDNLRCEGFVIRDRTDPTRMMKLTYAHVNDSGRYTGAWYPATARLCTDHPVVVVGGVEEWGLTPGTYRCLRDMPVKRIK